MTHSGTKAFLSKRINHEDGGVMKQMSIFLAAGMTAEGEHSIICANLTGPHRYIALVASAAVW